MYTVTETVTPEMARKWLGYDGAISGIRNIQFPGKRRIKWGEVLKLAQAMSEGRWELNGETICIDPDGNVIDGNHRCVASIYSNSPFATVVAYDVPPSAVSTIDIGLSRSPADMLTMLGVTQANTKSAAAVAIIRYDTVDKANVWASTNKPANNIVSDFVLEHDDEMQTWGKVNGLHTTALTAFAYLVNRDSQHPERFLEFMHGLLTGADLSIGDPRLIIRNQKRARWGGCQSELMALIIAWNAWLQGKPMRGIKNGRINLPMPSID